MGENPQKSESASSSTDLSGQHIEGHQINVGGDAQIEHIGDKISGDVIISGQVAGDVQVTYVQRAPVPPPPPPLQPPHTDLFVGRQTELDSYSTALDQAGIAVISGMAGVGKTALAAELARRVAPPSQIFWHSFHEGEGVESVIWRLASFLASNDQGELWALLNNTRQAGSKPPPPEMLFDYLVQEMRGHDFLLCLDDFQFVHENALLNQLFERIRSLLLSGELRVIITSRVMPEFVQMVSFDALQGLDQLALGQLLAANDLYLEEKQIARLHEYTAGNAQMLTLAVDLLLSSYAVDELLERLVETDDVEGFLMDEVESRLTRNEQLVMSAISILQGFPASQAAIEAVLDGRRLRRDLRDLSDRFLVTVTRGDEGRLYNQHAIVRDFFYEALNRRERKRMHGRAAEHYRDEEPDPILAIRHFLLGGQQVEAADLAEENVYALLNEGHASELDHLLEQIERGDLTPLRWIATRLVAGQVNSFLGESYQARENYEDALNELQVLQETLETTELHARICLGLAELLEPQDPQEALTWAERGLAANGEVTPMTRAHLEVIKGNVQMHLGQYESARVSLRTGLDLLPEGPTMIHARALKNLVGLSFYERDFDAGRSYGRQALAISRQFHDFFEESSILNNLGAIQYVNGDWPAAIETMEQALNIARRLGNRPFIASIENNLGKALIYTGAYERSRIALMDALQVAGDIDNNFRAMEIHINLAELSILESDLNAAAGHLAEAERLAMELEADATLPAIYALHSLQALNAEDLETAAKYAQRAHAAATSLEDPYEIATAVRARGLVAQAYGDLHQAEAYFRQSMIAFQEFDRYQGALSRVALGRLLSLSPARLDEAIKQLKSAEEIFRDLGAEKDAQQADLALANIVNS